MMKGEIMTVSLRAQRVRWAVAGSALALALVAPGMVRAQTAPAAAQPATTADTGEIIVTALKRAQSAIKVPAAISVVGGGDLKTVGVNTVNDLQNLVPGVVIGTGSFGTNVAIRGVTSTDQTSKGELGIAYNVDGAFVGRGQEQGQAYFDIDRVEVLRGPQGTLYGRSSTGGAINVITQKPKLDTTDGYARVEFGNYNARRAEAAVNLPLTDTLAIRVAGNFNNRDGFLKPQSFTITDTQSGPPPYKTYTISADGEAAKNDQVDATGRFSVLFKPSPDVTVTGIATIGHQGGVGGGAALLSSLNSGGSAAFNVYADPVPAYVDTNFVNLVGTINARLGAAQLDILASHQHFSDHTQSTSNNNPLSSQNSDGIPGNPYFPAASQFLLDDYQGVFNTTQIEARLSNASEATLDYVIGANYYQEHIRESDHNWDAPINSYTDTSTWLNAIDPLNSTQHKSYGVFAQGTYHLSSAFSVVAGLRYSHDETVRVGTFAVPFFNPAAAGGPFGPNPFWPDPAGNACHYPNDCVGSANNGTETDSKLTWKVGLNYQISPRDLLYASVATGFKAGGFNDFSPATGTTAPYGPESLTAYELGYKGHPLAGLTLTSSLYYYDYAADQINSLVFFGPGGTPPGVLYTVLAPVTIYGWENELSYQVEPNTTLAGNFALEHSRIKSLLVGSNYSAQFAYVGQPLDRVPDFTANASITHNIDLGGGARLKLRGLIKYSSSYLISNYASGVSYHQSPFTRSDASVTYAAAGDRFTIQLFVENIENHMQKTSGPNQYAGASGSVGNYVPSAEGTGGFPLGSTSFGVTPPRFFGVRLTTRF